ncbi:FtsX-like permease family protein [Candidatus Sumerlaeota bacterium]|nr:FtsX-like permease family protein [Candidatus Sumerlaeota bacterium]
MKLTSCLFLIRRNASRQLFRSLSAALSIAVAAAFLFLLTALIAGVVQNVYPRIEAAFPEKEIIVKPASLSLSILQISGRNLDTKQLETIRDIDGVEAAYPVLPVRVPLSAEAELLGQTFASDVVVYGVPPELLAKNIEHKRGFTFQTGAAEIPVVVSEYFLDIYNMGMAEANGLPKFTRKMVIGKHFNLIVGASTVGEIPEGAKYYRCVIVGLTPRTSLLGAMVPVEYARLFNTGSASVAEDEYYNQAHVYVASLADYAVVKERLQALRLSTSGGQELLSRVRDVLVVGLSLLTLAAAAVLAQALHGLFGALALILNERKLFIGLLRAIGANRALVRRLLMGEALLIGLFGGVAGCGVAHVLARWMNGRLIEFGKDLMIMPDSLFVTGALPWLIGMTVSLFGAAAISYLLIWRRTRQAPAQLIAETA